MQVGAIFCSTEGGNVAGPHCLPLVHSYVPESMVSDWVLIGSDKLDRSARSLLKSVWQGGEGVC